MDVSGDLARTLLELAPDPTVIVDPAGRIVFANAQVLHAFGYSPAELIGKQVEVLLPERFRAAHSQHRGHFGGQPKPRPMGAGLSLFGLRKNGEEFPVEISLSPVNTNRGLLVVSAIRDATVRKHRESELIEANRQKSRFLASASHDLRQPLTTLNLLHRVAWRHANGNAQLRTVLERQQLALDSMSSLLASVLDISKLDSGTVKPNPVVCSLGEVLDRVRSDFEPQATDKGLHLAVDRTTEACNTDPELLRRLLGNLVSNAIRYTNRGHVHITCRRNGAKLELEVKDTGIGIPAGELQRIFDEFYQVDRGAQRPEGLGLGLSIVRRLATLLHCELRIASVLDQGTVFQITLPRGELPDAIVADRQPAATCSGGRVLVVDDEPAVAEATSMLLESEGFDVLIASCEREALAHVAVVKPDVIVSDYHLRGGETGLKVVLAVREQLGAPVPVVFVTGDTARSAVERANIENARMLSKPMRADELLALLQTEIAAQRPG